MIDRSERKHETIKKITNGWMDRWKGGIQTDRQAEKGRVGEYEDKSHYFLLSVAH